MLQATCTQKMASSDAHKTVKTAQLWGHCVLSRILWLIPGAGSLCVPTVVLTVSHLGFLPDFPHTCLHAGACGVVTPNACLAQHQKLQIPVSQAALMAEGSDQHLGEADMTNTVA